MILFTFADAFDSLLAYMGAAPSAQTQRDCYQAIDEALRDLVNAHTWSYYYTQGRVQTQVPFNDGTIQYFAQDGAYPYQLTLTTTDSGSWPSWASNAYLFINSVVYRVDSVVDSNNLVLLPPLAPVYDIPAGTPYQLYQDTYELPADFTAQDQSLYERVFGALVYVHPREWLFGHRYIYNTGLPQFYTITGDAKYPNRMCVRLCPIPTANATLDFIYKRRPRPILWQKISAGTLALQSGLTAVTGTGTAFDQSMVGSVLRVSPNANLPTWMPGGNPATFEGIIATVTSPTTLTLAVTTPSTVTYSAATYVISDPIDIETGAMLNAFLRCCEHKLSQHRLMKDKPSAKLQYLDELRRAKEADSRSFAGRAEGESPYHLQMMKDCPSGPDMPLGI